jgi:hypothetical protein
MFDPEGNAAARGYSEKTFNSYIECYEFVELVVNDNENVAGHEWRADFSFRTLMIDSSYTMGVCSPNEQT